MSYRGKAAVAAAVLLTAGTATAQSQKVTGPVAEYWMSAATTSGFGAGMMSGGGQRPGIGALMRGAMNPNAVNKSLTLQLGSQRAAAGAPQGDHLPPPSLGAGQALPLLSPQRYTPQPQTQDDPRPAEMRKPEGRMLIFWGCGDHAAANQPLIIDFAQIGANPTAMAQQFARLKTIQVNAPRPPSPDRYKSYGEWPNEKTRATVPASGSLIGAHQVRASYSPPIDFSLSQDFLAPLTITGQNPTAQGGTRLTWNPVPNATGYFAWLMGSQGGKDIVMWTSANAQSFLGELMDYIPPAEARRLVASGAVMAPTTTACVIPAEVVRASPQGLLSMIAYGDEVNLVDPPRPANPKTPWDISWRVKVRYKSTTGAILGMPAMSGGDDDNPRRGRSQQQQEKPPSAGRAIGGAILRGGFGF